MSFLLDWALVIERVASLSIYVWAIQVSKLKKILSVRYSRVQGVRLHVVVAMLPLGAYLPADLFYQRSHLFHGPAKHPKERCGAVSPETFSQTQIVPTSNLFLLRIHRPRIVRRPNDLFVDVDEACSFQHLPGIVSVRNRSVRPLRSLIQVLVPRSYTTAWDQCIIVTSRLEIDFDLF
jgi:hypothetical protein